MKPLGTMRVCWISIWLFTGILLVSAGCGPALVAGGAAGGYAVGSDERSIGGQVDDAVITAKINEKYFKDPDMKIFNIDVDTNDGRVTLTGVVASEERKQKAETLARSVEGVKSVSNELQVK
ncbi:MAG: BON domain-containing protein [Deltaproteobacteria bacterium]|nr:BON domain-containing protein [Deltaproteobacteria bacterium]